MEWTVNVAVDGSAFPERTKARILEGLRRREVDAALLYGGWRQTDRWIALHEAFSPARNDDDVKGIYGEAFQALAETAEGNVLHVVGLGCGDGGKDIDCVRRLRDRGKTSIYSPCDISLEMVLTARRNATSEIKGLQCTPLLFNLTECSTMPGILKGFDPSGATRVILFLGSLHNFEPRKALKAVLNSVRSQDVLLIGANLAPEEDYAGRLGKIVQQYDNPLTREWLLGPLLEIGVESSDGALRFEIAEVITGLSAVEAQFVFTRKRFVKFAGEAFEFDEGEKLQVFRSIRFRRSDVRKLCEEAGLCVDKEVVAPSEEEGLYLCRRETRPRGPKEEANP